MESSGMHACSCMYEVPARRGGNVHAWAAVLTALLTYATLPPVAGLMGT